MKRFFAHLTYVLLVLPLMLIVFGFTYCSLRAENAEQSGALLSVTTSDLVTGEKRQEEYKYRNDFTEVTCTYEVNGEVVRTRTWAITKDDPLITDTFEVLPHPTATAAASEKEEKDGYVTVRYFDAAGNPEGWSEMTYGACNRLEMQHDFAADGTVLRVTTRGYLIYDYDYSNPDGTTAPTG